MPAWLIPAITAAASIFGGAAKGASQSRQQTTQNNLQQDQLKTSQYGIQQNAILEALRQAEQANMNRAGLDLSRRTFSLNAPTTRMQQAARGSALANAQDVKVSHPRAHIPEISGGMRPSMLTPETRQLGELIARQALVAQMNGDTFEDVPGQDWQGGVMAGPGVTPQPQAGLFEKIGGAVGMGGAGLDAVQKAIQAYTQRQQQQPSGALPAAAGGWTPPTY